MRNEDDFYDDYEESHGSSPYSDCERCGKNPATHANSTPSYSAFATCGECCGGCGNYGCDSSEAGDQSDNQAAARAVSQTIQAPVDRSGDTSRRPSI